MELRSLAKLIQYSGLLQGALSMIALVVIFYRATTMRSGETIESEDMSQIAVPKSNLQAIQFTYFLNAFVSCLFLFIAYLAVSASRPVLGYLDKLDLEGDQIPAQLVRRVADDSFLQQRHVMKQMAFSSFLCLIMLALSAFVRIIVTAEGNDPSSTKA